VNHYLFGFGVMFIVIGLVAIKHDLLIGHAVLLKGVFETAYAFHDR
jgi:uncharacterized membrane protein HdeD (DUF308 family)